MRPDKGLWLRLTLIILGVKYSLIVLGGGWTLSRVSVLIYPWVKNYFETFGIRHYQGK